MVNLINKIFSLLESNPEYSSLVLVVVLLIIIFFILFKKININKNNNFNFNINISANHDNSEETLKRLSKIIKKN